LIPPTGTIQTKLTVSAENALPTFQNRRTAKPGANAVKKVFRPITKNTFDCAKNEQGMPILRLAFT
jgi:hypothetical protein